MGKDNRKRRALKQAKKKKRKINQPARPSKGANPLVFHKLEDPFGGLTGEKRKQAIALVSKECKKKYHESLDKIRETISEYDPLILLSILTTYSLFSGVGEKGVLKKDSDYHLYQYHLEYLQALILHIKKTEIKNNPCGPEIIGILWDALPELMETHNFASLPDNKDDLSNDKKAKDFIQFSIRANTKAVRNWGYFSQVLKITSELYSNFNSDLESNYGFNFDEVVLFFKTLRSVTAEKNNNRLEQLSKLKKINKVEKLVNTYCEMIGLSEKEADKFLTELKLISRDVQSIFYMLLSHNDILLVDIFKFNVSDVCFTEVGLSIDKIAKIYKVFSYNLGDLENHNIDYFYLSNPVWSKPMINLGSDNFFCVLPQVFFSFIIPTIENMLKPIVGSELSDKRANYLEEKVRDIICKRFPKANTVSSLKWNHDGKEFETDVITFIDSHALIVEAKSGKITEPALRGATDRIKRHVEEILIEPNIQSKRLKEKLEMLIADPSLSDPLREQLPVDLKNITKVIRVSVSLEDFGAIQSNIKQLIETGWLPKDFEACPTMNIADFETLFDFLDHPVQIIHYLERRQYVEENIGYMADELDLMGLYCQTLFNMGEIKPEMKFNFIGMSDPIDNYYSSKDAGMIIEKPKPKITKQFNEIFSQLEKRNTPRWTEIGVFLNYFSPEDQIKLEKMAKRFGKKVQKNWRSKELMNIIILNPPKASNIALSYIVYNDKLSAKRDEYIDIASRKGLEPKHVEQCLVIAKNIDDDSLSYHFIGLFH